MSAHEAPSPVDLTVAAESQDGRAADERAGSPATRGRRFGRYLVLGMLGRGGMGVVVEAHDEHLDRTVAIKVLHLEATRTQQTRLLREAQALARLSHPNVVQVYDIGTVGERTFIAMELVRGRTLSSWRREQHPWRETVEVFLQAARGLAAAHAAELVHRDFKPDNCILGESGRVRVVDFGLARQVGHPDPVRTSTTSEEEPEIDATSSSRVSGVLSQHVTRDGAVLGTVAYMSYEQLGGEPADARSDQYSFCASLFEAIHGVRPYAGATPVALLDAMMSGQRVPPKLHVPRRLRRALERGLSREAAERWPSMDELVAELEAVVRRDRWRSRGLMLGLGVALGGGVAMAIAQPPEPCPAPDPTVDGAWNDAQRRRLGEVVGRLGPADDEQLLPRITAHLDEYARAWGEMAHESCVATYDAHRQSERLFELRARCLERRRNRLASAVDELAKASDPATLLQSAILPFKLPALEPCADGEALAGGSMPPDDAELRERHAELRRRLDRAEGLRESGRFDPALALVTEARDEAILLDEAGLLAEALEQLGRIQAEGGSKRAAKATLERAIVAANRAGDDEVAAQAWLSLLYATALQGELDEAEYRAIGAEAAVERADDPLLRAWYFNDLGILASESNEPDAAREHLEHALELKAQVLGERHVDVGIAWFNLGMMLSNAHRYADARDPMITAMSIFAETVGPSHPLSAYANSGLCNVALGLGDARAAAELCGEALARFASSPVSGMWESRVTFTMAEALWRLGERARAREFAQRALRLAEVEDPGRAQNIENWLEKHPT